VSRQALDQLKQQIPLLDYLRAHGWRPARQLNSGRWMGLCPLHADHNPSILVEPSKSLFYCYDCGRGGDVIRFAELHRQVTFPQALALLAAMDSEFAASSLETLVPSGSLSECPTMLDCLKALRGLRLLAARSCSYTMIGWPSHRAFCIPSPAHIPTSSTSAPSATSFRTTLTTLRTGGPLRRTR